MGLFKIKCILNRIVSYNLKFVTTLPSEFQEPNNNKIENMHDEWKLHKLNLLRTRIIIIIICHLYIVMA